MRHTTPAGLAAALGVAAVPFLGTDPAAAEETAIAARDVVAVMAADWTGDGAIDRAVLVDDREGMADLLIFTTRDGELALTARSDALAWVGGAWGTLPELALSPSGALQVVSVNEAIGRHRWRETLTIVYRQGSFVVAGYTNLAYDTLDPAFEHDCDINLLTGRGEFNGAPFRSPVGALPVARWAAERDQATPLCPAG